MATATPVKRPIGLIANHLYPDPRWSDEQRQAHAAAQSIKSAMLELRELYVKGVIRSEWAGFYACDAWLELEREIAPLFAEDPKKEEVYASDYCADGYHNLCTDGSCNCGCHQYDAKEES